MIVYPKNWRNAGVEITPQDIETRIVNTLAEINCRSLAFSGGLDSSLLLYFMCEIYNNIKIFTVGKSNEHMDVLFAKKVAEYYRKRFNVMIEHWVYCPENWELKSTCYEKYSGDNAVELFYKFAGRHVDKILAGDGIDEFMCGYYDHMRNPNNEAVYYYYLRRLQQEHLAPLDINSDIAVCLPYLDEKLISLMSQIPLSSKVEQDCRKKFLIGLAKDKVPDEIIIRRKYGFCDALKDNK